MQDASDRLNPEALAADFKALAHEKRIRLMSFLLEPRSLEEVASELGVARQTAHEHLQQLLEVGLVARVEERADGRPGMAFVAAPHRLFQLYEMVGRLGAFRLRHDAVAAQRRVTQGGRAIHPPIGDPDLPRLILVHGMRVGQTTVLAGGGPWLLGRDPHATVCLDYDPYASARHAEIRLLPGGGYAAADLYSSNGTWVDWNPLDRGGQAVLENGSLVQVGRTLLSFRWQPAAGQEKARKGHVGAESSGA